MNSNNTESTTDGSSGPATLNAPKSASTELSSTSINKAPKNESKTNSKSNSKEKEADVKNRGWPKGKKRYPKSPGAPKQPLSGYVHFLNDHREAVRRENPEMSFADISKKLASEWGKVDEKVKQEYASRAEADKERYFKEFATYRETDEYKEFMAKQKTLGKETKVAKKPMKKEGQDEEGPSKKIAKKAEKKSGKGTAKKEGPTLTSSSSSVTIKTEPKSLSSPGETMDIPIFREEFLEHNKAREQELRQLRKQANEFEEQNAILQKHVENMRSAITKLEHETLQQQESNASLAQHLDSLRRLVVQHFSGTHLSPMRKETLTVDNVDAYMRELRRIVTEKPKDNEPLVSKARDIASRMNYDSLILN